MTPQSSSRALCPTSDEPLRSLAGLKLTLCEPLRGVAHRPALQSLLEEAGCLVTVSGDRPAGFEPSFGRDLGLERDIDALFLGNPHTIRRLVLLRRIRRMGVPLVVNGDGRGEGVWGEARTLLLNRTKILVGIPRWPGLLAGLRLILGLANGALVISEPLNAPAPFVPGTHFVSAPLAELPATIRYYLEREDERSAIVSNGLELVTEELTMRRSVSRLIGLLADVLDRKRSS